MALSEGLVEMRIPLGNRGDSSRSGSRTWVTDPHRVNERYQRAYGTRGGPKGATGLDLYFAKEPTDEPLLLFHHIPKTAGTSLRNVINSNYADAAFELVPIDAEEVPDKLAAWYQDLWQSLGSKRERLVCAAGHFAGFFLGVVPDRPVSACTILRDPVDRVISRYFFFTRPPRWTLNDLYGRAELKYMRGANFARGRNRAFFNGESQSILQTFYETEELPLTADEPDCDLWRKRLFELVDRYFVVGIQERFTESIELFARKFGWQDVYTATARVNRDRPPPEEFSASTVELIREYNWLDCELHAHYLQRLGEPVASPAMSEPENQAEEEPQQGKGRRERGGTAGGGDTNFGAMASRAMRRAQRAWTSAGGDASAEADFFVRLANAMATLELARVLRESNPPKEDGS